MNTFATIKTIMVDTVLTGANVCSVTFKDTFSSWDEQDQRLNRYDSIEQWLQREQCFVQTY